MKRDDVIDALNVLGVENMADVFRVEFDMSGLTVYRYARNGGGSFYVAPGRRFEDGYGPAVVLQRIEFEDDEGLPRRTPVPTPTYVPPLDEVEG